MVRTPAFLILFRLKLVIKTHFSLGHLHKEIFGTRAIPEFSSWPQCSSVSALCSEWSFPSQSSVLFVTVHYRKNKRTKTTKLLLTEVYTKIKKRAQGIAQWIAPWILSFTPYVLFSISFCSYGAGITNHLSIDVTDACVWRNSFYQWVEFHGSSWVLRVLWFGIFLKSFSSSLLPQNFFKYLTLLSKALLSPIYVFWMFCCAEIGFKAARDGSVYIYFIRFYAFCRLEERPQSVPVRVFVTQHGAQLLLQVLGDQAGL